VKVNNFNFFRIFILGACALFLMGRTSDCFAKDIPFEVSADKNKVSLGSSLQLSLNFNGLQNMPAPELPEIKCFQCRYLGPSTMMSIVNGKVSGSITHNYMLLPVEAGVFKIGPFRIEHNGDKYVSNQIEVEVLKGQPQSSARSGSQQEPAAEEQIKDLGDRIFVKVKTGKSSGYLNEEIPLSIKLYVKGLAVKDIQYPEIEREGFSIGAFGKPDQYQELYKGINYDVIEFKVSVFGLKPGQFMLGPAHIKCTLLLRNAARRKQAFGAASPFDDDIFDNLFGGYQAYPLDLKSDGAMFTVFDLPSADKPADFAGALGNFSLEAGISPSEVKLGDPVTLEMIVSGNGNFSTVGAPRLDSEKGLKVYEPQVKQEAGRKTFEQVVIPVSMEVKEIPAVTLSFFDTQSGKYVTLKKGPFPVRINKPDKEEEFKIVEAIRPPDSVSAPRDEKLGRDILYIKDNPGKLKRTNSYLYKNKVFLGAQVIPLLVYLITLLLYVRKKRLDTDIKYARGLAAPRKARAGLAQAKKYLKKAEAAKFYDTLFLILREYLGDRFHLSSKGITISVIDEHLRKAGVEENVLSRLKDIFKECDMVRYASGSLGKEDMQSSLDGLEEIIDYLQRKKT